MRNWLFVFLMMVPSLALAQYRAPTAASYDYGLKVDGAGFGAAEAVRTAEVTLGSTTATGAANWSKARVEVNYTKGDTGIATITVTPWCKRAINGTYARFTTRSCTAGTCTVSGMVDSWDFAGGAAIASSVFILEYDVRGCYQFKVVVDDTGPAHATDSFDVGIVVVAGE